MAVAAFNKITSYPMPETQGDLCDRLRDVSRAAGVEGAVCVCVLEQIGGFVGKSQPGSAMFRFGEGFGFIKGTVQALGMRLVLVRPQTWQKDFGLGRAADCVTSREWKNKLKAEAQRRFPQLPVTLATADALLMLDWAMRTITIENDGTAEVS